MKTIRQIADEIGVSKQAVFKKIKREPLSTSLQGLTATVDGRLMVEVDGEKLIKQAFSEIAPSTKNAEKTAEVDGVISVLQATIDTLQEQLEVKDQQIEKLTEALLAAQKTAAAAQALHAGMIQQQFLTNRDEIEEQGEGPVERQGWLRRLFHGLFL